MPQKMEILNISKNWLMKWSVLDETKKNSEIVFTDVKMASTENYFAIMSS